LTQGVALGWIEQGFQPAKIPKAEQVRNFSKASPFKAFGSALAFKGSTIVYCSLLIVDCSLLIVNCSSSFAAFSVVARHSSSQLGSALAPMENCSKIAHCSLLIVHCFVPCWRVPDWL